MSAPSPTAARARAPSKKRAGILAKLIVLGVMGLLSIVFLEIGVRLLAPQPKSWLSVYRHHPRLPFFAMAPNAFEVIDTGESRWEVYTDQDGFRIGKERVKSQGKPLALWMGDSYAFGHGTSYESSWVGRLARDPNRRFEYRNAGVPGYGPTQYASALEDHFAHGLAPKLVLVSTFLGNDFHDVIWDKQGVVQHGVIGYDGTFKAYLKINSHLYRLLSGLSKRYGRAPKEVLGMRDLERPEAWKPGGQLHVAQQKYEAQMARLARVVGAQGVPLVVMVVPSIRMLDAYRDKGDPKENDVADARLPIVVARRALRKLGIRTVEPIDELIKRPSLEMYFPFDQHFSPAGHEVVTRVLKERVPELR